MYARCTHFSFDYTFNANETRERRRGGEKKKEENIRLRNLKPMFHSPSFDGNRSFKLQ